MTLDKQNTVPMPKSFLQNVRSAFHTFFRAITSHSVILGILYVDVVILMAEFVIISIMSSQKECRKIPHAVTVVIDDVFFWMTVAIYVLLVLELLGKIHTKRRDFLRSKGDCFYAAVLALSLPVEIIFRTFESQAVLVIVLLRFWRLLRYFSETGEAERSRLEIRIALYKTLVKKQGVLLKRFRIASH